MKISINNTTGQASVYREGLEPPTHDGVTIVEVTPEIQAVIDQGGPFKWDFETETLGQVPLADLKSMMLARLNTRRLAEELGGTTVAAMNGLNISTDKEAQNDAANLLTFVTLEPAFEIHWRFPDGEIILLNATKIQGLARAVFNHVAATRAKFKQKATAVAAATTKAELKALVW